jgi:hypothetical protein
MGANGRTDRSAGLTTAAAAGPAAAATAALARRTSRATLAPARAALHAAGGTAPVHPGTVQSRGRSPVLGPCALPRREPAAGSPGISSVPSGLISSPRRYFCCGTLTSLVPSGFSCPVRPRIFRLHILSVFVQLPIVGLVAAIHKCFTQVRMRFRRGRAAGTELRAPPEDREGARASPARCRRGGRPYIDRGEPTPVVVPPPVPMPGPARPCWLASLPSMLQMASTDSATRIVPQMGV